MIIYTQTPDYYDECLQHGWLKDQAAKVHKYIERWRGKNGKWYYKYTNSIKKAFNKYKAYRQNLNVKDTRRALRIKPDQVTSYTKKSWRPFGHKYEATILNGSSGSGSGRPKSHGNDSGSNGKVKEGIEAGRERRFNKKRDYTRNLYRQILNDQESNRNRTAKIKDGGAKFGKSAALSKRGYSDSKSGGNNAATKSSSVVMRSRNKNSLSNRGYHSSKSTYNSEGDSRYRMLNNRMDYLTTEEKTNYYKGRTGWRKNMTPAEQYYQLSLLNPKKYNEVASPQIKREIENRKKKRKN